MASLVLGVAGAYVGSLFGMPALGWSIGSAIGSSFTKLPDQNGPRLTDLRVSSSTYGQPIRQVFGTARVPVNVIWSTPKIESKESESVGKGGPSQDVNTFTYSVSMLLGVCKGPITGITRIWASGNLIFDIRASNNFATGTSANIRISMGTEDQLADSFIDAYEGIPTPAYRGLATVMLQDFQLADYGNQIPNFECEVVVSGNWELAEAEGFGFGGRTGVMDPLSELLFIGAAEIDNSLPRMEVWDPYEGVKLASIPIDQDVYGPWAFEYSCIVDPSTSSNVIQPNREIWFSNRSAIRTTQVIAFSLDDFTITRSSTEVTQYPYEPGGMFYIPSSNTVWIAKGDTVNNPDTTIWSVPLMSINTSIPNSPIDIQNIINVPDLDLVFANSIVGLHVYTGTTGALLLIADYPAADPPPFCYDETNRRIILADGDSTFVMIDVDTLAITEEAHSAQGVSNIVYDAVNRQIITFDGTDHAHIWNENTYALEQSIDAGLNSMDPKSPMYLVDRWIVGIGTQSSFSFARIPRDPLLDSNSITLAEIVTAISLQCGLTEDDINVSALTDEVFGYVIDNTMTGKAAIEPLMVGFLFDAVETG